MIASRFTSSAHIVIGETVESTPVAAIRAANLDFKENHSASELLMPADKCQVMKILRRVWDTCAH